MRTPSLKVGDHYQLPILGRKVSRCYIDTSIGIEFFDDGPSTTVRVEGVSSLRTVDQDYVLKVDEKRTLSPILEIVGKKVKAAMAFKDGSLRIMFDDDNCLDVKPDPQYEAWELSADNGLHVVCQPGGGLAVWEAENNNGNVTH